MSAYQDLKKCFEMIIHLENCLKDFYDVAEIALRNKESKVLIELLRKKHVDNLQILKNIHVEDYGNIEWVKYSPECNVKNLIPIGKIKRESPPGEIIEHILECEEKIKNFYNEISNKVISRDVKDLFDSLTIFKERQIIEIKKFMEEIEYL